MMLWEEGRFLLSDRRREISSGTDAISRWPWSGGAELERVPLERADHHPGSLAPYLGSRPMNFAARGRCTKCTWAAKVYSRSQSSRRPGRHARQAAAPASARYPVGIRPLDRCPRTPGRGVVRTTSRRVLRAAYTRRRSAWSIPHFTCRRIITRASPRPSPGDPDSGGRGAAPGSSQTRRISNRAAEVWYRRRAIMRAFCRCCSNRRHAGGNGACSAARRSSS